MDFLRTYHDAIVVVITVVPESLKEQPKMVRQVEVTAVPVVVREPP